jgi:hypothetical protein
MHGQHDNHHSGGLEQTRSLKKIHDDFVIITGLKINFTKSIVVPINLSEREGADIAEILGCPIDRSLNLNWSYHSRIRRVLPYIEAIERRVGFSLPQCVIEKIDRLRRSVF